MGRKLWKGLLALAALGAGICLVRAQAGGPLGFATPNGAAVAFAADLSRQDDAALVRLVSAQSTSQLQDAGVQRIVEYFQDEGLATRWAGSAPANPAGNAVTVQVAASMPVAVVREKTGGQTLWRVDIVATLAGCLNLDKEAAARKVFSLTGVALPGAKLPGAAKTAQCLTNLHLIGLAMGAYLQDNDERYPGARNWYEALHPYGIDDAALRCPIVGPGAYGYALNWKLSNKSTTLLDPEQNMVGVYETFDPERNARGSGSDVAQRHDRGSNYLYAASLRAMWQPREATQNFAFGK